MAALLTSEMGNQDKLLKYIAACKDMDIPVDRPSVNTSRREFIVRDGRIIFGLGGVKNVGDEAIREIIQAREEGGPFASLLDLCSRVNLRKVTKRVMENLIKGGACDCLACTRASMFAALDLVVARAQKRQKEKDSSQMSLFSLAGAEQEILPPGIGVSCEEERMEEWRDDEKMRFEKEALGFFLTSHPLQPFRKEIVRLGLTPLEECRDLSGASAIKTAVLVTGVKEYITKKGDRMAFCQVEDLTASGECTFFPDAYAACRELLHSDMPLLLECRPSERVEETRQDDDGEETVREIKLLGSAVTPMEQACADCQEPVCVDLKPVDITPERIAELKALLGQHKGPAPLHVRFYEDDFWCRLELSPAYTVQPGRELENDLALWAGAAGQTG
jgi:DNA polymerase-3 subunit alpha